MLHFLDSTVAHFRLNTELGYNYLVGKFYLLNRPLKMKNVKFILSVITLVSLCSFAVPGWLVVENKKGKFSLSFPGKPTETEKIAHADIGELKMEITTFDVGKMNDANKIYMLMYSDYPAQIINSSMRKGKIDTFFKNAIEGAINNVKGKMLSVEKISYKGYPGRHLKVSFSNDMGIMDIRMFLVKNRNYFLEVGYQKDKENNPSIDKFFKSFKLLN